MKILVTGATGFVGSAVAHRLAEAYSAGCIRVLVRAGSDLRNLNPLPVEVARGDLQQRPTLTAALEGCDTLFHVAADYRLWVPDPDRMYATNVRGTENLMRAALRAGVQRIVYTSSVATIKNADGPLPADEGCLATLEDMVGHYKRSKFMAEALVRQMVRTQGLPAVIVNPSTPVGPRDVKSTPTGQMILRAAQGRMPAYVDTGLNFVHVDDVAAGHLQALEHGRVGERYILGGENMTLRQMLALLCGIVNRPRPRIRLPVGLVLPLAFINEAWARATGSTEPMLSVDGVRLARKYMYFSSDKARKALGFRPRPVQEAFKDAVAWFRDAGYLHQKENREKSPHARPTSAL